MSDVSHFRKEAFMFILVLKRNIVLAKQPLVQQLFKITMAMKGEGNYD